MFDTSTTQSHLCVTACALVNKENDHLNQSINQSSISDLGYSEVDITVETGYSDDAPQYCLTETDVGSGVDVILVPGEVVAVINSNSDEYLLTSTQGQSEQNIEEFRH